MGVSRPARAKLSNRGKPKRVHPAPPTADLAQASRAAIYERSPYHCRGNKGEPPKVRARPASICPRRWTDEEATNALRAAIGRGNVSEVWEDGFPRHVWHRDGDVLYEARHTKGPAGSFHAYPIEEFQAPRGQLK